jgi:hypothetical protein
MSFESRAIRLERAHGRAGVGDIVVTIAADFLHGGEPTFARAFDRRGSLLMDLQRLEDEPWEAFKARARVEAGKTAGGCSLFIGGLPDEGVVKARLGGFNGLELPRGAIALPEAALHLSQVQALELIRRHRRVALVCGRRWGKSTILITLAVDAALSGKRVGVFAPTRTLMSPLLMEIALALQLVPGASINRVLGEIRLPNGGHVDFWSIDHTQRAARGRKYHLALVDESAHDEGYLGPTLEAAIAPATLDYRGKIVLASTPNGLEGAFWEAANQTERGYAVFHAPTSSNPFLPVDEIAYLRSTLRSEVASQELDAQFVDLGGATIFPISALLLEGSEPHPDDFSCQMIGLAIDSNSGKGGPDRDGCAAVIFALTMPGLLRGSLEGARMVFLDWDIQSLAQGGVAPWLMHMRERAMAWFRRLKPLGGPPTAHIEPAGNGFAVIEAARAQGLNPHEIDDRYVMLGKDGRALAAEPHATAGRMKIGRSALDRRMNYRGVTANHLTRQVTGFRAFDKDSYRREDDLFDAAIYAVLVSLGDGTETRWSRLKRVV